MSVLKQYIENGIVSFLYRSSWFRRAQLDSLLCRQYCKENGLKIGEGAKLRDYPVTFGSYDRSCRQGSQVLKRSLVTLLASIMLGLIDREQVLRTLELADVLQKLVALKDNRVEEQALELIEQYLEGMI